MDDKFLSDRREGGVNSPKDTFGLGEETRKPMRQNPRELDDARYAALDCRAHNSNHGINDGSQASFGVLSDGVFGGLLNGTAVGGTLGTGVDLTTAWNVNAAYEHFWSPRWRTSLYGGYAKVTYGGEANNLLCTGTTLAPGTLVGATPVSTNFGCSMDWQTWWVGSRTQWNITKDFYMGLDVMYSKLNSANFGAGTVNFSGTPTLIVNNRALLVGGGAAVAEDMDNWSFRFRVHRDFYP